MTFFPINNRLFVHNLQKNWNVDLFTTSKNLKCWPFPNKQTVHSAKIWNVDLFPINILFIVHKFQMVTLFLINNRPFNIIIPSPIFGHAILIYIHILYYCTYLFIHTIYWKSTYDSYSIYTIRNWWILGKFSPHSKNF